MAKAAKGEKGFAKRFCRRLNPAFVCECVSCLLMFDKFAAKWCKTGELHIYVYIYICWGFVWADVLNIQTDLWEGICIISSFNMNITSRMQALIRIAV